MRKKLTTKGVEALIAPGPRRLEVWDVALPGFGIRVSVNGHRSWFCAIRRNGRVIRHTLGSYARLSLADAREAARTAMNDPNFGTAPSIEEENRSVTLGEVVPQFIELYARPKNRGWKECETTLNQKFGSLFEAPIRNITRQQIIRILDDMVARTPVRAVRSMAALKKLFNWALDRGLVDVNPIAGMSAPAKCNSRERVLGDDEIRRLLQAAETEGYPSERCTRCFSTPPNGEVKSAA